MTNLLKSFYKSLPIIRELTRLNERLAGLPGHLRLMEASAMVQALEALKAGNDRYRDPKRLMMYGAQYWSQNYEDGIIAEIFRRIGTTSKTFLEIGVGDGSENNTTALLAAGWSGWWIDGDRRCCESIKKRIELLPRTGSRLKIRQALVSRENISEILKEMEVPDEVDLFSLDIDLNTYHIWATLKEFRPRVAVIEYNSGIAPEQRWIHPYEPDLVWDYSQNQGASLKAYELLGLEFGYSLVGCDIVGMNAFFIRNDVLTENFAAPFTSENHYEPPRYGLLYRWGHRSQLYV